MSVYLWVKAYINLVQHYHHMQLGTFLWNMTVGYIRRYFKSINIVASVRASSYNYACIQRLQETFYRVILIPGGQHIQ